MPAEADRVVWGYCRVSTDRQVDGLSLDDQERMIRGRAMELGLPVARIYIDAGVSGSIPFAERPEGGKLIRGLRPGAIVIAAKLDRCFRDARDALDTAEKFRRLPVSLYLLDMGGDVTGDGMAKIFYTMLSAFAEYERWRIRQRVIESKSAGRARGDYLGGSVPFGYRLVGDKLEPDPAQQELIAEMRRLHDQGESIRAIEKIMKARGHAVTFRVVRGAVQGEDQ